MRHIICGFMLAACLFGGSPSAQEKLTAVEIDANIRSIDLVWTTIRDKHFDTTFGGKDWNALREQYRPVVETVTTMAGARQAITAMLNQLGVSHCNVIPKDVFESLASGRSGSGNIGVEVRLIDDRPFIFRVLPNSPAANAGVTSGWEIVKIGDDNAQQLLAKVAKGFEQTLSREYYLTAAIANRLKGVIGEAVVVSFRGASDSVITKDIPFAEPLGKEVRLSNLPPYRLRTVIDTLADSIGYFSHTIFLDPVTLMAAYDSALRAFEHAPGLIIDIRGNPGGIGMLGVGMAGSLIAEKDKYLGMMITRTTELKFVLNPRTPSYSGPVALIVDALSASTSEIFAGGLKDIGRVRVFGTRTTGAALPATIDALPNGDAFMHPMANYISFSGQALEASGVIPDEEILLTKEALLKGDDPVVEAAVAWIRKQESEKKSGNVK